MENRNSKFLTKAINILMAVVLLVGLTGGALAVEAQDIIALKPGVNEFTYDVVIGPIEEPFASAQFDISVSDANELTATGISFTPEIQQTSSGRVNTITDGGVANGNQVTYKAGFLSVENQYQGLLAVCSITFRYTGNTAQTITINNLETVRFTGNQDDEGLPELEKKTESWSKTITVMRDNSRDKTATPTANPLPGTYSSARQVTLLCQTPGAKIYYTTDGSTPTRSSILYTGTITVSTTKTIKAIAVKDGYDDSDVAVFAYTISGGGDPEPLPKAASPAASPVPGIYNSAIEVTLSSATAGASIYYTSDGSTPSSSSLPYTGAITISSTCTIKAIAIKDGYEASDVAVLNYTIYTSGGDSPTVSKAAAPKASPAPGNYTSAIQITLSSTTAGAKIYYTTDGSTPTSSSTLYSKPISLNESATVKAIAIADGYENSAVATFAYTIAATAEPPDFKDVDENYLWARDAIRNLAARGVILGDGKGNFKPQDYITRADFVVMLTRLVVLDVPGNAGFDDVENGRYYTLAISKAYEAGLVKGTGGNNFNPHGYITRQDAFTVIYRLIEYLEKADDASQALSSFKDGTEVSSYAQKAISFLAGKGIVQGSNGYLKPLDNITRAEMAVLLDRLVKVFGI